MASTPEGAAAQVERLSRILQNRRPEIQKRLEYVRGESGSLRFASDEFKEYFGGRYDGFSDNWCLPVTQAPAERMTPLGIHLDPDDENPASDIEKRKRSDTQLRRVWMANECDRGFSEAALVFIGASRSFGLVHPFEIAPGCPRITWEHPEQCIVDEDPVTGLTRYGLVTWTDDGYDHATLYTPTALWKMKRQSGVDPELLEKWQATALFGWEPREEDEFYADNPLGEVPLFELRNQSFLDDRPRSDIQGVMSAQDAINLVWAYLFNGLDYATLGQRIVTGAEPPRVPILNETGEVVASRPVDLSELVHERVMFVPGENVRVDEWAPAQLDVFLRVVTQLVEHVAAQTRTPPHYLLAKMVNTAAEALTISEAGLVSKTQERITLVEPALRRMYRLVALAQGDKAKADAVRWSRIMWQDVQYRSEIQRSTALKSKWEMGYPLEYLLERDGVAPWDIPRVMEMRRKEQELDPTAQIARGLAETGAPVSEAPNADDE